MQLCQRVDRMVDKQASSSVPSRHQETPFHNFKPKRSARVVRPKLRIAFPTLLASVLILSAPFGEVLAGFQAQQRKLLIGRQQLEAACDNSGGIAWGTQSDGAYGCVTDNALIMCNASGVCDGWTADELRRTRDLQTSLLVFRGAEETPAAPGMADCPECRSLRDAITELDHRRADLAQEYQQVLEKAQSGVTATLREALDLHRRLQVITYELELISDERELLRREFEAALEQAAPPPGED